MPRSLQDWEALVRANVRAEPPVIAVIAQRCHEAEGKGENCSVWHQASSYFGTECQCYTCCFERLQND